MNKDKQNEAQRHASRDTIIKAVFHQLVYKENSLMSVPTFL